MEALFHSSPFSGYVYPNETVIPWTLLIVVYPYLTGLVAGAFTISSLYQVFGFHQLRPVAHFALLVSLCCMVVVPLPLLLHLGHPERAFNAMITPHITSAFAVFAYAALFYVILLTVETWFVFRPYIVHEAQRQNGVLSWIYRAATLGSYDLSENAMSYDRKWLFALAIIGIPGAHGLHGYVGFVFGSLKAREWWSSDLMPAIFLFSAIISGTALVIVLYVLSCKLRKVPIDLPCLKVMAYSLWAFHELHDHVVALATPVDQAGEFHSFQQQREHQEAPERISHDFQARQIDRDLAQLAREDIKHDHQRGPRDDRGKQKDGRHEIG